MLSVVVFIHCINDGIHLGVFVIFLLFYFIIFYALFSFQFFSNVHPNPAIHRLATTVKRLKLLPGVTTLFTDSTGGQSLVPLITSTFLFL